MPSHKPQDYTTVSPYLVVDGASRTIDFLRQVFDAVELRRFADQKGGIVHAEVRIDEPACAGGGRRIGPGAGEEGVRGQAGWRQGSRRDDLVDRDQGRVARLSSVSVSRTCGFVAI
jgi:hypothetical protein